MIDIVLSNGDSAEAETPEAAVLAARTLMDDVWEANPRQGNNPTAAFYVNGVLIRTNVKRHELVLMRFAP